MKNNCNVFALILFLSIVVGCKKENKNSTPQPQPSPVCRITAYQDDYTNFTLEYSTDGHLAKTKRSDGKYIQYTYSGSLLIATTFDKFGVKVSVDSATVNTGGRIQSVIDNQGNTLEATYDAAGYLTSFEVYNDKNVLVLKDVYTIVDGNAVEKKTTTSSGTFTTAYEYLFDKENKGYIQEEEYDDIMRFFQKPYKNIISKAGSLSFSYTFDTDGFPTQVKVYKNGSLQETRSYSFECK